MPNDIPRFSNRHLRATLAALGALGHAIPIAGESLIVLQDQLASHIDEATFSGLIRELEKLQIISFDRIALHITRGPEWKDGLERLRLRSEQLRRDASIINRHPDL